MSHWHFVDIIHHSIAVLFCCFCVFNTMRVLISTWFTNFTEFMHGLIVTYLDIFLIRRYYLYQHCAIVSLTCTAVC